MKLHTTRVEVNYSNSFISCIVLTWRELLLISEWRLSLIFLDYNCWQFILSSCLPLQHCVKVLIKKPSFIYMKTFIYLAINDIRDNLSCCVWSLPKVDAKTMTDLESTSLSHHQILMIVKVGINRYKLTSIDK